MKVERRFSGVVASCSGVLLVPILGGCQALSDLGAELFSSIDKPTASLTGVSIEDFSLQDLTMLFDVEVQNPYDVGLPLVNLDYGLASGSNELLTGAAPLSGEVPAGGSKALQLPARIEFKKVLAALGGIKPGSIVPYTANLSLNVNNPIGGEPLSLPLSTTGELPIPTVPDVKLDGVRFEELTFNNASAVLDLSFLNTNDFPFDLKQLSYGLSLAGTEVAKSSVRKPVEFSPGERSSLEIPISFSPKSLGLAALNLLKGSGASYSLVGDLDVDTPYGPLAMPLNSSGQTSFTH